MHSYSDDVDRPTCKAILQVGYQLGERIVRPARVAVVEPEHAPAAQPTSPSSQSSADEDDVQAEDAGHEE